MKYRIVERTNKEDKTFDNRMYDTLFYIERKFFFSWEKVCDPFKTLEDAVDMLHKLKNSKNTEPPIEIVHREIDIK